MNKTESIDVTVDIEGPVVAVAAALLAALEQVPVEYRNQATLSINLQGGGYDDGGAFIDSVSIEWDRPLTEAEEREAIAKDKAQSSWQEQIERAEFERLKRKFENQ